jgi:hypothetical protein
MFDYKNATLQDLLGQLDRVGAESNAATRVPVAAQIKSAIEIARSIDDLTRAMNTQSERESLTKSAPVVAESRTHCSDGTEVDLVTFRDEQERRIRVRLNPLPP